MPKKIGHLVLLKASVLVSIRICVRYWGCLFNCYVFQLRSPLSDSDKMLYKRRILKLIKKEESFGIQWLYITYTLFEYQMSIL